MGKENENKDETLKQVRKAITITVFCLRERLIQKESSSEGIYFGRVGTADVDASEVKMVVT